MSHRVRKKTQKKPNWGKLSHMAIIHLSRFLPLTSMIALIPVNKWYAKWLRSNFVWKERAQRLKAAETLPPVVWNLKQTDHFWFNWFKNNSPRLITVTKPRKVMWTDPDSNVPVEKLVPRIGCLLAKGSGNYTNFFVCVDMIVPLSGKWSDMPYKFTVAKCERFDDDKLQRDGKVQYNSDSEIQLGLNNYCNPTMCYVIIALVDSQA